MYQKTIALEEAQHLPPLEDTGCVEAIAEKISNLMTELDRSNLEPCIRQLLNERLAELKARLDDKRRDRRTF